MPRQSWIDQRTTVFVDEAAAHGFTADPAGVAEMIGRSVRATASQMGITEITARRYVSEDSVREWARDAASSLSNEAPGQSLLELEPTHTVPMDLTGRTLAALAIAADLALSNTTICRTGTGSGDAGDTRQVLALITEWGVLIEQHHTRSAPTDTDANGDDDRDDGDSGGAVEPGRPGTAAVRRDGLRPMNARSPVDMGMVGADPVVPAALIHRAVRFLTTAVDRLDRGVIPSDHGDVAALAAALEQNITALTGELE